MKTKVAKTAEVKNEVTVVELTSNENKVLGALVSLLEAEAGFSDIEVADLARATKMKADSVKGVIGSLVRKELVFTADAHEHVGGAKGVDLIYLSPMAWSLHPDWKEEAEFELQVVVKDEKVAPAKKTTAPAKKATAAKKTTTVEAPAKTAPKKSQNTVKSLEESKTEEVFEDTKNKPYSVYGMHGHNTDLEGFKKGDKIVFQFKGEEVVGEYVHLHINNWSKKGYVVIKYGGKIIERVPSKVAPFVEAKPTKAPRKRATPKTSK